MSDIHVAFPITMSPIHRQPCPSSPNSPTLAFLIEIIFNLLSLSLRILGTDRQSTNPRPPRNNTLLLTSLSLHQLLRWASGGGDLRPHQPVCTSHLPSRSLVPHRWPLSPGALDTLIESIFSPFSGGRSGLHPMSYFPDYWCLDGRGLFPLL